MTETTTTTPTIETPKATKPVKAKKASKPKSKAKAKSSTKPTVEKKDGLRPLQVRVLKALSKKPMNRSKLYAALGFANESGLNDILGKNDLDARAKADKEKYPCLLTLKAIKMNAVDVDGRTENVYEITATGRKLFAKAE